MCRFGSTIFFSFSENLVLTKDLFSHKQGIYVSFRDDVARDERVEAPFRGKVSIRGGRLERLKHPTEVGAALGTHAQLPRVPGEPRVQQAPRLNLGAVRLLDDDDLEPDAERILDLLDDRFPTGRERLITRTKGQRTNLFEDKVGQADVVTAGTANEEILDECFLPGR